MTANPTSSEDAARTPLAILTALALVLPGLLLGGLAALVYSALMAGWDEGGQWNPTFVGLFEAVWIDLMPHVIRGTVAIAASLSLTFWVFKRVDRTTLTCVALAAFVLVGVFLTAPHWYRLGALTLGFVLGALPIKRYAISGGQAPG